MTTRIASFAIAILITVSARADFPTPFAVQNQNPFVSLYGLPRYASADILGVGETQVDVSYAVASSFDSGLLADEAIWLDGESQRWGLRYLRGIGKGWEIGIDVPLIKHSGGYLDGLIIDWHDWFGLPQGGRDQVANDQFEYAFNAAGSDTNIAFSQGSGLGDVQLLVGKELNSDSTSATVLRGHVKLATGNADELFGSGGYDLSVTVDHVRQWGDWGFGLNLGATYLSEGDVLAEYTRSVVGQFGLFAGYAVTQHVSLLVQWDVHSQVFDRTELRQLNEIAYLLSFGADVRFGNNVVRFAVVENFPHPEVTPDVAFQLSWQWHHKP
jgi:hypothetical protein